MRVFDRHPAPNSIQNIQSRAEPQRLAVWWLLERLRHPDQYPSRLQIFWRPFTALKNRA